MTEGTFGHDENTRGEYKKEFIDLVVSLMEDESEATAFKGCRYATGLLWNDPNLVEVEYETGNNRN